MAQFKLNNQDVDAVVLVDTDGLPYAAGGGGGGGDTSNITTVGNAVPTKAAYIAVKNGSNTGVPLLGQQANSASVGVTLSTENITSLTTTPQPVVPSGSLTTTESSVVLSAATSATVAASNANRLSITIDNPSASDIWINTQGAAVATAGSSMRIFGNTQVCFSVQEIGTNAITAISTPGTTIRYREISKA